MPNGHMLSSHLRFLKFSRCPIAVPVDMNSSVRCDREEMSALLPRRPAMKII
jgi:hypothetical protein